LGAINHTHGNPCHLSNDLSVSSIRDLTNAAGREWVSEQEKLIALQLAPGTRIAVAEFNEIDRTIEFSSPLGSLNLPQSVVDLNK
jgi:hypothetical protein